MLKLSPLTARKLKRFRQIRRGYYSLVIIVGLLFLSAALELLVNNRAVVVSYEGELHFPTYSAVRLGGDYGLEGPLANIPVNYRQLKDRFREADEGNWVLLPLVPYGPNENNAWNGILRPRPPSWSAGHYLGTDSTGRDILARLCYGFRTAMIFALAFTLSVFVLGILVGCLMGYFGSWVDLIGQRLIEIWSNIPFLYVVIIIYSVVPSTLSVPARITILMTIMVAFSWMGLTYYMRTGTYKEKARDYVSAARVLGAGSGRIIWKHILPNSVATIITFLPFTVVGGITAVTALDFLGFGLPPPTASMGELLKQGVSNLRAWWIVSSAFGALVLILTLVTFVGEAVREAFDPKKFTVYQ
jgi:microcin C transport system permease protein